MMVNAAEHIGLVYHIAKKYTNIEFDDAISAGSLGLVKAANTFDESRGFKFATYASRCINNEILMFLRKENPWREFTLPMIWVNEEGNDFEFTEVCANFAHYDDDPLEREAEFMDLRNAVSKLNERERLIIQMRFYENKTQSETAKVVGVEQSYISRLERLILKKLKGELNEKYQH